MASKCWRFIRRKITGERAAPTKSKRARQKAKSTQTQSGQETRGTQTEGCTKSGTQTQTEAEAEAEAEGIDEVIASLYLYWVEGVEVPSDDELMGADG